MPILSTCIITYLYTLCLLDNGSTYTAHRVDQDTLQVYVDWKLVHTIYKGEYHAPQHKTKEL